MTDTDLHEMLREQRRHEPAFTLDPAVTIRAGRRRRLVRTSAAGIAAAAVIGAAGVGVAGLATGGERDAATDRGADVAGSSRVQQATPPPAPQSDQPPGTYLGALAGDTFGVTVADLPQGDLTVLAPPDREVSQSDPAAQHFSVSYRTNDRLLVAGVVARPADEVSLDRCEGAPTYTSCTDAPRSDGSVLSVAVGMTSAPDADGMFRMYTERQARKLAGEVFFRRSVTLSTPDGLNVYADELVRADTEAAAEAAWAVPTDALESLVTDSGLTSYPLPHLSWH